MPLTKVFIAFTLSEDVYLVQINNKMYIHLNRQQLLAVSVLSKLCFSSPISFHKLCAVYINIKFC